MKLRLLTATLISIILILVLSIAFLSKDAPINSSKESPSIKKAIELVLNIQSARRGEHLDFLVSVISESPTLQTKKSDAFYIEFLKGYIASANNQFNLAEKHFNHAKQYMYTDLPAHVLSRFYYERSYIEIKQKQYKNSKLSYQNAESLFNSNQDYSKTFISISLGRTYDLAHVEKGSLLSIQQAQKTLEFAQEIEYSEMEHVYFILGLSYWNNNQTILGIDFKLKALNIYIEKKQYSDIVYTLTDIGIDYLFLKNYDEAIRQLTQALEYQTKNNSTEPDEAYYIVYKLYSAYFQINDIENAKHYLDEAERLLRGQSDSIVKENFQTNQLLLKAEYLSITGKAEEALMLLTQASERHANGLSNSFYHFDISLYNTYGKVYNHLGLYNNSIHHHTLAKEAIQKRKLFYLEDETYFYLYDAYLKQKDYQKAAFYLEKSHAVKAKQLNDNNQAQTQFLLHSFDNKKKENRILELEKNAIKIMFFSGFLLSILVVIAAFVRILFSKNKKINALNIKLHELSLTDGLTAVPNRRALELHFLENKQDVTIRSVMMIDIDYFKNYNDTYGHKKGDEALIDVAKALKESCRENDFLARFGGEEFIIVMKDTNKAESIKIAENIQASVASLSIPHKNSDVSSFITLSMGITTYSVNKEDSANNEKAIIKADKALYYSKNNGRNQNTHFYDI
ncbi:diguanylate cyclase [Aliivibrio finisterrensis]|uniref:tetratricopeptide repeat-containing diguanylate cyclase n=1 Tax=Aliivibrio finisterrensis TaxID=511998 RepID=UPI00102096F0|nr:tetratricopeptide repeat-containing diguanylate cyclase [Aliivibrio finisterrensis]RYU68698.1 diguanylate cyclase [Aliivibrio finisterrensis]RYU72768.1 diguanylate cyclase [Aliivibrio finisterrensis]RYU72896.1 diguanylate cyclase [Aliivibrio finisterrensis]